MSRIQHWEGLRLVAVLVDIEPCHYVLEKRRLSMQQENFIKCGRGSAHIPQCTCGG